MQVLFISRAFPPVVGGIENQNAALALWLPKVSEVTTLANRRGKKALPFFLPLVLIRALIVAPRYDVVLLGDGVLAIVGWVLKLFRRSHVVVCIIHGLDVTYPSRIYQAFWVRRFLPGLDRLIAVSQSTLELAQRHGISGRKLCVLPNGVDPAGVSAGHERRDLEELLGQSLKGINVILTIGRLVKRKGVEWFISNVMPELPESIVYVVAGEGPELGAIEGAAGTFGSRVRLLGRVKEETKDLLLGTTDLFVQPNIPVEADAEGFGIALLEAGMAGLPVVAARLEGLREAIQDGENGWLVEPGDSAAFAAMIRTLLSDKDSLRQFGNAAKRYVMQHYDWRVIVRRYLEVMQAARNSG